MNLPVFVNILLVQTNNVPTTIEKIEENV